MYNVKFEEAVADMLQDVTGINEAGFTSGTLFVVCTEDVARKIFHIFTEWLGLNSVVVSKCGEEYAYDFV